MKTTELAAALCAKTRVEGSERTVCGCYIGDLMSLCMAHLEENNVWITIQTNQNVIAVAALKEASCVILADGSQLDDLAAAKAEQEGITVLESELSAYALALRLGDLGI